jgi:light-regulated signal transduction histidine kinase (bacteriophytochrome)
VCWQVEPGLTAQADERLTRLLLEALFENAWKFSARRDEAVIAFGAQAAGQRGETTFFVRDNGAGFDPVYAGQLFEPFQRLHSAHEFEGAGMGLAVARRIVARHGGRIWAQGQVDQGAVFFFTIRANS